MAARARPKERKASGTAEGDIRVVIADDHRSFGEALQIALDNEDDLKVIEVVTDGESAIESAQVKHPDVLLMDVQMPGVDGLEATRRLLAERRDASGPRVVMLTTFDLDEYVFEALRAGASGFLLKNAPAEDLVAAIRTIADGDALLAPAVTRRVVEAFAVRRPTADARGRIESLSPRERDVLRLAARGLTNREIADHLVVGEATVKTHIGSILAKLGARDRVALVIAAYEAGVVETGAE
jgi:DNA-binding NarL/FixJ family response regulator